MNTQTDLILANDGAFEQILNGPSGSNSVERVVDAGVSIDDVVIVIAIRRNSLSDRESWWKVRREVYGRYASHPVLSERTLAQLPTQVRDEIAEIDDRDLGDVSAAWTASPESTTKDFDQALRALVTLRSACETARSRGLSVYLMTELPANEFEREFKKLSGTDAKRFANAFERWDDLKRYQAHQKLKYYKASEVENSLALVLREMTRSPAKKVNLVACQKQVMRYIKKRVRDYTKRPQPDVGSAGEPVTMISIVYDIEYVGSVNLLFSTLPDATNDPYAAEVAPETLDFPQWLEVVERLFEEGKPFEIAMLDASKRTISSDAELGNYEQYIGEMLRDSLIASRNTGVFSKLPLSRDCVMRVGGPHVDYLWPERDNLNVDGRVALDGV